MTEEFSETYPNKVCKHCIKSSGEECYPCYLFSLSERLRNVPVMYGVDGGDISKVHEIATGLRAISNLEDKGTLRPLYPPDLNPKPIKPSVKLINSDNVEIKRADSSLFNFCKYQGSEAIKLAPCCNRYPPALGNEFTCEECDQG